MQLNKTDKNPRFPRGLELSRPMLQAGALIFVCRWGKIQKNSGRKHTLNKQIFHVLNRGRASNMGRLTSTPLWICPFYSIDFHFRNEQKCTHNQQLFNVLNRGRASNMGRLTSTPLWICPFYSIDFHFRNEQKCTHNKNKTFFNALSIQI